jgi:hypothetical protein
MKVAVAAALLQAPPALKNDITVFDFQLDVFVLNAGEISLENKRVIGFIKIHGGIPAAYFAAEAPGAMNHLIEQALHFLR